MALENSVKKKDVHRHSFCHQHFNYHWLKKSIAVELISFFQFIRSQNCDPVIEWNQEIVCVKQIEKESAI